MRRIAVTLALCALPLACGEASRAAAEACRIDPDLLLPRTIEALQRDGVPLRTDASMPEVAQRTLRVGDGKRMVISARWDGPSNGSLLLAECHGIVVDVAGTGFVEEMEPLAEDSGRTLLRARTVTGTGSGWRQTRETVFLVSRHALRPAWSGVVAEVSSGAPGEDYEIVGEVARPDATTLVHRTVRYPLHDGARDSARARISVDTFRWDPASSTYSARP